MLQDALQLPSGTLSLAHYRCLIYLRVPDSWVEGAIPSSTDTWLREPVLSEHHLELAYQKLYGPHWRQGNDDGSIHVVRSVSMRLLNPTETSKPWLIDNPNSPIFRYFYFDATLGHDIVSLARENF
jgi:hypothetical protein